ncbi:hypothetical protein CHH80_11000 [Bacillus sp. 7504-2]|jgi:hypothetical protein|nr:hypothetical protein CHH80_11000 [Bacillus sp. 7504-2]
MSKAAVKNVSRYVEPQKNRVIVLDGLNFFWDRSQLDEIVDMWESEFSIRHIAKYFKRDPDEILLALIHLAKEEKIVQRKSGLFGIE